MPGQNTGKIQLQRGTDPPSVRAILEVIERVPHLSKSDLYDPPSVQIPAERVEALREELLALA